MWKTALIIVMFSLLFHTSLLAEQNGGGADEAAIRQVVQHYMEWWTHGDVKNLRKAFHPEARLIHITSGDGNKMRAVPYGEIFTNFETNDVSLKRVSTHEIAALDVSGGIASVKLEIEGTGEEMDGEERLTGTLRLRETQYLSLIKFDSGWKIVANVSSPSELFGEP